MFTFGAISPRRQPRRVARLRATVEVLDVRRLMAGGLTATPIAVAGNAGSAVGDGLAEVALLELDGTATTLPINDVTATIDWGDGSAPDAATLRGSLGIEDNSRGLAISGPRHIYAQAGTYSITIAFTGLNNPTASYQTNATIAPAAVMARPISVSGRAGSPLNVLMIDPGGLMIGNPTLAFPIDFPVPLLNLLGSGSTLPIDNVTATVEWGDGSPLDAATVRGSLGIEDGSRALDIGGPQHIYARSGTYTITIAFTGLNDPTATYQTTASIAPALLLINGQLNPLSDSGVSSNDGITNVITPNFVGTTAPGATIVLYATSAANPNFTIPVGIGVADESGHWNVTTVPFLDGSYHLVATTTSTSGSLASLIGMGKIPARHLSAFFQRKPIVTHGHRRSK